jgi:hypothetical protein
MYVHDENMPIINKTKHPTKGEQKQSTRWKDPKSWQIKKPPKIANHHGNKDNSSTQTLP